MPREMDLALSRAGAAQATWMSTNEEEYPTALYLEHNSMKRAGIVPATGSGWFGAHVSRRICVCFSKGGGDVLTRLQERKRLNKYLIRTHRRGGGNGISSHYI